MGYLSFLSSLLFKGRDFPKLNMKYDNVRIYSFLTKAKVKGLRKTNQHSKRMKNIISCIIKWRWRHVGWWCQLIRQWQMTSGYFMRCYIITSKNRLMSKSSYIIIAVSSYYGGSYIKSYGNLHLHIYGHSLRWVVIKNHLGTCR